LLTVSAFGLGFALAMAFFAHRQGRSVLSRIGKSKANRLKCPLLSGLWLFRDDIKNSGGYALAGLLLGAGAGYLAGGAVGLALGAPCFLLAPEIVRRHRRFRFERDFRRQYPGAVTALAACSGVGAFVDGFRHVAFEYSYPVSEVFGYIDKAIENGLPPSRAVEQAMERYGLPVMRELAESFRLISEIGAGEKARDVLESAADQVRFQERYRDQINTGTAEIRASGILACVLPATIFILMSIPGDSPHRYVLIHDRTPVYIALAVIGLGWLYVKSAIGRVRNF